MTVKNKEEIEKLLLRKRKTYFTAGKKEREAVRQFVNSIWIDVLEWVLGLEMRFKDMKSMCCGIDFIEDTDVCTKCHEHSGGYAENGR